MHPLFALFFILAGGLYLSARSMRSLLYRETTVSPTPATQQASLPTIIEDEQSLKSIIEDLLTQAKNKDSRDIVIEKIHFHPKITYAIYTNDNASLWSHALPEGYIVKEGSTLNPAESVLAHQYVISHKYDDLYYISSRSVSQKPAQYITSGIDTIFWQAFLSRQHTATPALTTGDRIHWQITNHAIAKERRTL